ncbi:MAG: hypothetical protein LBS42_07540 [Tannerella sp.]|jgi:hypothetical protein|nr:hypothetical protein [Tannerella sp.]
MKKLFVYFAIISLFSAGAFSCGGDGDDDGQLSGKPARIKSSYNDDVSFSYQDDRLLQITENGDGGSGSTYEFGYGNDELSSLSSRPTDPRIADGDSYHTFKKDDSGKITVEITGFAPDVRVQEIELDANFPVKITDMGRYSIDEGGVKKKTGDGEYYSFFSWNATTGQLLKEEVRRIETSETVAVYTYKYDGAPGVLSGVDCPLWFYAYWNRNLHFSLGTYKALFFGYANNLTEATVDDSLTDRHEVLKYVYDYGTDGLPVSVSVQTAGGETLTTVQIQY